MAQNSCPSPPVANNPEVSKDLPVMAAENKISGFEQDDSVANVQCSKTDSSVVQDVGIIIQSDKEHSSDQSSTLSVKCDNDVLEKDNSNSNEQNEKEIAERNLDLSNKQSDQDYSAEISNNDNIESNKELAKNVDAPDVNKDVSSIECNGVKSDNSLKENTGKLEDEVSQQSDHESVLDKHSNLDTTEHSNNLNLLQDNSSVKLQDNLVTRKEPMQEKENSISSILGEHFAKRADNLEWVNTEDLKFAPKPSNLRLFRTTFQMNRYGSDLRANKSVQESSDEVTSRMPKRTDPKGAQKRKTIWLENFKSSTNHPHSGSLGNLFESERNKLGSATRARVDDENGSHVPCNKSLPLDSNANNKSVKKDCLQSPVRKRRQITPKGKRSPYIQLNDIKHDHCLSNLNSSDVTTSNTSKHKFSTVTKRSLFKTKSSNTSTRRPHVSENKKSICSTSNNNHTLNSTASSNLRDCYVKLKDITLSGSKTFSTLENARPGCSNSNNSISYNFQCANETIYRRAESIEFSDDEEEKEEWEGWMSHIGPMKGTGLSLISILNSDGCCTRQLVSDSDDDVSDLDHIECLGWGSNPSSTCKDELEGAFRMHHNLMLDDDNDT